MPKKGEILEDPQTKNRYEFLETAESTNGAMVSVKMSLFSRGKLGPDHVHTLHVVHF